MSIKLDQPAAPDSVHEESGRPKSQRSFWLIAFSFGLAAVLVYLVLRGLDWQAFWNTLRHGHYVFLLLTIPIASVNYLIRAARWRILVQAEKKTSVGPVFWANMVGYLGNAYLPARAGELLRAGFLGRKTGLGISYVLATALAERVLDAIALVLIGSISLLWQGNSSPLLTNAVRITALIGALGLGILIIAPFQEKPILRVVGWLPLPGKISRPISEQISRFLIGMRTLQSWRRLLTFILLTAVIWLVDAISNTIGVHIISQSLTIGQALILLAALGLSSAIPSTPGYIGVYQFVAVTVLIPFGFSRPEALAYILISQVLGYGVISFWGLLGLWQINKNMQPLTVKP